MYRHRIIFPQVLNFLSIPAVYLQKFRIFAVAFNNECKKHSRLYTSNHHLGQESPTCKRASAHSAQAFRRLQGLVVSRKCVEMACAFLIQKKQKVIIYEVVMCMCNAYCNDFFGFVSN
jgi:hypothetical protein